MEACVFLNLSVGFIAIIIHMFFLSIFILKFEDIILLTKFICVLIPSLPFAMLCFSLFLILSCGGG